MTARQSRFLALLQETAPFISIAIALVVPSVLPHDPAHARVSGPDPLLVVKAVEELPYRIDTWVGEDVPMPESAVRLLRPNAALSRRYRNLETSTTIDFVFVHCSDARDMLGHYPPVCYPNSGWVFADAGSDTDRTPHGALMKLALGDRTVDARMYVFSRMQTWSEQRQIRIFNFFILPDGSTAPDIEKVSKGSDWLGASIQGVGQVQLVTDGSLPLEHAVKCANDILQGSQELFEILGVPPHE